MARHREQPHGAVGVAAPADTAGLGARVRRGALWSGLNTLVLRFGNIALMAVVVRLVTPHEFGVFAVAVTVQTIVASLSVLGVISVLTRADTDADAIAPTVGTISILSTGVLSAGMFFGAPWLASALGSGEAVGAIRIMSLAVFMVGVFAVPGAMLARDFEQDKIFFANMIAFVPSNGLLLLLAALGDGSLAFAWSRVVGQAIAGSYMTLTVSRRYHFGFSRKQARFVLGAGLPLALAELLSSVLLNADYAFVGRQLGPARLGIYVLAFNVANWTTWLLGAMVNSVAMPAFSRVKSEAKQLSAALLRANKIIALLAWPACAISLASARPLIETIYGHPWVGAAPVLAVLAPYAVLMTHSLVLSNLLAGTGHGRALLLIQGIWLVALIPTMAVGIHLWGTIGVAIAHVVVIVLIVAPAYLTALHRLLGVTVGGMGQAVAPAAFGAVAAALTDVAVSTVLHEPWAKLIFGATAGGVVYLLLTAHQLHALLPDRSESGDGRVAGILRKAFESADRPRGALVGTARRSARRAADVTDS